MKTYKKYGIVGGLITFLTFVSAAFITKREIDKVFNDSLDIRETDLK